MIRAILVDNEPLSLQLMQNKLQSIGDVQIVGMFANAESAFNEMKNLDFQVAFITIEMEGLSGLDLAEIILEWNNKIHIIFVTAYRDYAIQAFEINSLDYLLKPVMKERLEKSVSRLREIIQKEQWYSSVNILSNNPPIKITCFDEFTAIAGEEPIKWKTSKVKELFAFLVMNLNSQINRDVLIEVLWPEQEYKKAKNQLHSSISYLRRCLEKIGLMNVLTYSNQCYSLSIDNLYCDAVELERVIDQCQTVTMNNIGELEEMMKLYVGDYMEKNDYKWSLAKAQTIKEKFLHTLQLMINYYNQNSDHLKKRQCLQMVLKYDPYCEKAVQQLLLHDFATGNRTGAIKIYQDFSAMLNEELGIDPEDLTKQLYKKLENGIRV